MRRWSFLQCGVLALTAFNTAWAVAGLIANPSFATGDDATSVQVLGVDFNGWHAVAGLLVFAPGFGFVAVGRPEWTRLYALAVIVSLAPSGVWAAFDARPLGIWPFEHQAADAVLHLVNAAAYALLLVIDRAAVRRTAPLSQRGQPQTSRRVPQ